MNKSLHDIFIDAKNAILHSENYSQKEKVKGLYNLLSTIIEEITDDEKLVFNTLFSRAAFMGNKYKIDSTLMYYLHLFRRDNERMKIPYEANHYINLGNYVIDNLVGIVLGDQEEVVEMDDALTAKFKLDQSKIVGFRPIIEAVVDRVDASEFKVYYLDEEDPVSIKTAHFDQSDRNELFNDDVEMLDKSFELPIHVNFIDAEILENGDCLPSAMVIQPDYLQDVTSIANCFKSYGTEPMLRMVSKFKKFENSTSLMVGNIANLFLDEIISNPEIMFKELLPLIFKVDPIGMTVLSDKEVIDVVNVARDHYLNLKRAVSVELPAQGIRRDKIFLEPSFYSRDYGVQGRLDLFHVDVESNKFDIVELKSGKQFMANVYGLNANHYVQTLVYDLMIKSTYGYHRKPNNYILYSKLDSKALKYAPLAKSQQYEALKIRNKLIALENLMAQSGEGAAKLFSYIKPKNFEKSLGFEKTDIINFEKKYNNLSNLDKAYLHEFASFIAREQRLAKTGEHGINKSNGLAALWLENTDEKEDRFAILKGLTIDKNDAKGIVPTIQLSRTEHTSELANFRRGDIAVLYPHSENPKGILKNQIFKCTVLDINEKSLTVKLRSRQYNDSVFQDNTHWNIEEDSLDSGFNRLNRSLYEFINAPKGIKELWMGMKAPSIPTVRKYDPVPGLTDEQNELLDQMMACKDYFLLWGPPGTGKTSVMIKNLVKRVMSATKETVLLLAYTNRAVDEICQAISSIDESFFDDVIRVGSSTSCGDAYRYRVLDNLISGMTKREQIRSLLKECRIFVSTVSSIISKGDLFNIKAFDRVIIDEASQILEPQIVGLLNKVNKVTLIGDHKQLPAVVTQKPYQCTVQSEELKEIGIVDLSMSLFERLYLQCKHHQWNHAFGQLTSQGRMHEQLMQFPNVQFYDGNLKVLSNLPKLKANNEWGSSSKLSNVLVTERLIYIPAHIDEAFNWKTNIYESRKVVKLLTEFIKLYEHNDEVIAEGSIGVITPYRAQIARIKKDVEDASLSELLEKVTIDTVERYQGGARDTIILSLCTNRLSQLKSLVSLSKEGVDRKLNVALTRARQRLIIIGNKEILSTNDTYKALIESAFEWKI